MYFHKSSNSLIDVCMLIRVGKYSNISFYMSILTHIRIPTLDGDVGLILSIYGGDVDITFTPRLSEEHSNFGWFLAHEAARLLKEQYPPEFTEKLAQLITGCNT
jgi:hypothetical protein